MTDKARLIRNLHRNLAGKHCCLKLMVVIVLSIWVSHARIWNWDAVQCTERNSLSESSLKIQWMTISVSLYLYLQHLISSRFYTFWSENPTHSTWMRSSLNQRWASQIIIMNSMFMGRACLVRFFNREEKRSICCLVFYAQKSSCHLTVIFPHSLFW